MPKNPKILKTKPNDVLRSMGNNLSLYVGPNDELYILDQLGNLDLVQNYVDGGTSASPIVSKVVYCTLAEIGATSPTQPDILELMEIWVNNQQITKLPNEDYIFVLTSNPPPEINFDIEATHWANGGITDEASFISFLEGQGATDVVVTDFSLVVGRLQCNLSFDGTTEITLENLGIITVNKLDSFSNLTFLDFDQNFSIAFGPNFILSSSLENLDLAYCALTTESYEAMEEWANNQPLFTNPCTMVLVGNTNSPIGTNFETIMNTKNASLIY